MSEIVIEYPHAGVAVVRINRPEKRNACNQPTWQAIAESFDLLERNSSIRLAILTGTGEHFSAGDDIVAYNAAKADPAAAEKHRVSICDAYDAILRARFPVISAVRGACVGGAVSLAMCCDFRVADDTARVCIPAAKLSLIYPTAHIQRLVHLVGASTARRWLYSAEFIDAAAASDAGFFDALATTDVIKAAIDFAQPMLDKAPLSIRGSRMQVNAICSDSVSEMHSAIDRKIASIEESVDYREAVRAFRDKVVPRFVGS
ncbi:enoyl-CoA hydratase/isomerase family protein [Paraburkholderia sp. BL9I2N2]|uniref:enoyl-CoA hydratase/isomerase family protein n=1 Tax=Paraburkholderia sp. BL9I2N2 TaxID=1938809 RepID=UPI00104F08CE|nr:enoyl-CoA hydratase/isomerase family protein [Paraburkholderia sp. BL9I2N2]TCK84129.1 enoyl-CoA hydratase [Paraburkholderia sp. BL9I2N2]